MATSSSEPQEKSAAKRKRGLGNDWQDGHGSDRSNGAQQLNSADLNSSRKALSTASSARLTAPSASSAASSTSSGVFGQVDGTDGMFDGYCEDYRCPGPV